MNKLIIRKSKIKDAFELAPRLRVEDIEEVSALNSTPLKSLLSGFYNSDVCYSLIDDNQVVGMYGYSGMDMPCDTCSIWMLGSETIPKKYPSAFIRIGKMVFNECLAKYDRAINWVDVRNSKHIKWLGRMGAKFSKPVIINGYKFIQFCKEKGVK